MLQSKRTFWGVRPGFDIGDILHIMVNAAYVAAIYLMVKYWSLLPMAMVLVVMSKWRVLAVQPRFWLPNIKANIVDIVVGISTVSLLAQSKSVWISIGWATLYLGWLLFLKPKQSEFAVGMQALWAQTLGSLTIFSSVELLKMPLLVIFMMWIIGWAAARHYFSDYEEPHYRTLSLVWGFLVLQWSWVALHWVQFYSIGEFKVSSFSLILAIITLAAGNIYHSYKKGKLNNSVMIENGLFFAALLAVVLATSTWSV